MSAQYEDQPEIVLGFEVFPTLQPPIGDERNDESGTPWLEHTSGAVGRAVRRMAIVGDAAVNATVEALGASIARVARGVVDQFDDPSDGAAAADLKSVELTFGVKLTSGAGKVVEAFVTAGGETTIQVKVVVEPRRGGAQG